MARRRAPAVRRRGAGPAARRRNHSLEARLAHPVFDGVRRALERLGTDRSLERLNALAQAAGLRTESGKPVRFVRPGPKRTNYELEIYATGAVQTRQDSLHDFFNALVWLAFPRTKARINAMHAAQIPRDGARRGRLRDLLTIFDEGGAIVQTDDQALVQALLAHRWKELFWENRERVRAGMRVLVFGHAVLEKALAPWPGVTCKVIVMPAAADPDAHAAGWLARLAPDASPRDLAPLPVYGYPGWMPQDEAFYDDARYFRQGKT